MNKTLNLREMRKRHQKANEDKSCDDALSVRLRGIKKEDMWSREDLDKIYEDSTIEFI